MTPGGGELVRDEQLRQLAERGQALMEVSVTTPPVLPPPARGPEGMQVDAVGAPVAAASSSASAVSVQRGDAQVEDAHMGEQQARRVSRPHSEAPMRKLSVSLIDTYKLINQVSCSSCLPDSPPRPFPTPHPPPPFFRPMHPPYARFHSASLSHPLSTLARPHACTAARQHASNTGLISASILRSMNPG